MTIAEQLLDNHMTIRELIQLHSERLREADNLSPQEAATILVELCSLLSSLNTQTSTSMFELNKKRAELLQEHKTVAKAKMLSDASEEWKQWFDMVLQKEALLELIRGIKYHINVNKEEYKITQ